jgi:hypothetical protein
MAYDPENVAGDIEFAARLFAKLLMRHKEVTATLAFASLMVILHDDKKEENLILATQALGKIAEKCLGREEKEEWPNVVEEMRKDAEKN